MRITALHRFLLLAASALLLLVSPILGQDEEEDDGFEAIDHLEKFGYLDDMGGHSHSENSIIAGLSDYQRFHGLDQTGFLDPQTIRQMKKPRCGIPDLVRPNERPANLNTQVDPTAPLAFNAPGYKWPSNQVSYKWVTFTNQLGRDDQRRAIANAFQKWSDVTPLRFSQSNGNADIMLSFGSRDHGDGSGNSFDGRSGTLAHAFFPGRSGIAGDTHFDNDELWTVRQNSGTNLEIVAAHEFGHAIGLGHSSHPTALMAPVYRGYDPNYALHQDDINGVQSLYGAGSGGGGGGSSARRTTTRRPPRVTTPRRRRPETTRRPNNCRIRFQAVELLADGRIVIISNRTIYTMGRNGIDSGVPTRRIFPRAPSNPGALVYDRYRRKYFFFKGSRYWRYSSNFQRDRGYPRTLPQDFQRVTAAIQWRDGAIYLFRGDQFMKWAENFSRYSRGYPRQSNQFWRRFPNNPVGFFRARDGYAYAFKGRRFYKYSPTARLQRTYPKDFRSVWLGCSSRQLRRGNRRPSSITANDRTFLTQEDARESSPATSGRNPPA